MYRGTAEDTGMNSIARVRLRSRKVALGRCEDCLPAMPVTGWAKGLNELRLKSLSQFSCAGS